MEVTKTICEIVESGKLEDSDYESYRKSIVEKIIELEKIYYKITKLNIKSLELFDKKIKFKKQLGLIREEIKRLYITLNELDTKMIGKKCQNNFENKKFNNQIIGLDYKFKIQSYELFNLLKLEPNSRTRISIINQLKRIYSDLLPRIDKNDFKTKTKVRNILQYLNKTLKKENLNDGEKIRETINKNNDELSEKNEDDYNAYKNMEDGKKVDHYTTKDIIESFRYLIRHGKINSNMDMYVHTIINRIITENKMNDEEYLTYLYSIYDSIKYRKLETPKENEEEIKNLKKCICIIKDFINLINVNKVEEDKNVDYRYDIVCELLSSCEYYFIIKNLVNRYPQIVNVRKDQKPIIEFILKKYIDSYKKLLQKDMSNYISIDYLREVYILFSKSESLCLTNNDKKNINFMIREFIEYVFNNVKSSKRKNHIVKELKNLSTHHYYDEKTIDLREINGYSYDIQLSGIKESNANYRDRKDEIDLSKEYTIMLSSDYICYSFIDNGKTKSLKIHTCDISNLIPRYKALDNYIYNSLLCGRELNDDILDALKFNINCKVSAFTYEIILNHANQVIGFKIYRSKIKPNMRIYEENNNNRTYNRLRNLSNSIMINQNYIPRKLDITGIEQVLHNLLNDIYLENIRKKEIPYIYSGTEVISSLEDITIYSNIKELFNKLQKEDFIKINNVLNEELKEFHYSDKPFNTMGDYDLNLLGKPNYIMLQNQRLIKTLYMNELNLPIESYLRERKRFKIEYNNLLVDLNNILGYIEKEDFYHKKKKVKKKVLFQ